MNYGPVRCCTGILAAALTLNLAATEYPGLDPAKEAERQAHPATVVVNPARRGSAVISGRAWRDYSGDGIQDSGDSGVHGVVVMLQSADGLPIERACTDGYGRYEFQNVPAGSYSLAFIQNRGYLYWTVPNQGLDDNLDSDVDQLSGQISVFSIQPDDKVSNLDAGLVYGRRRYADGYNTNSFNPVDNNGRAKDGAAIPQDPQKAAEHQQAEQANQVFVKNLLVQAEALFRAGKFREAYQFYTSVTHSTLEEARGEREQALARIREMDELAKQLLRRADDAALARDYGKEIECLSEITKQFHFSGSNLEAAARLSALKSKPEVVGYLLLADAERLDAEQRYAEAMKFYRELTENERYAMTVPGMKAARRIKELEQNPDIMNEIKTTQHQGEITRLLRDAKNFALNKRWHEARSLYEEIRTRFPDTPEAAEAAQRLADLGNLP